MTVELVNQINFGSQKERERERERGRGRGSGRGSGRVGRVAIRSGCSRPSLYSAPVAMENN